VTVRPVELDSGREVRPDDDCGNSVVTVLVTTVDPNDMVSRKVEEMEVLPIGMEILWPPVPVGPEPDVALLVGNGAVDPDTVP
jgi:hypothetical protein